MNAKKRDNSNASLPRLRALILEDNPGDAKLCTTHLERGGYDLQFDIVDTPDAFKDRLAGGEFDIIIADYNLHTWTAMDALEILKQSGKDIPMIVSTGSLGDEPAVECVKHGAADFVLKDRPPRLPVAVRRALEEKRLREEHQQALEALRDSERQYRLLFRDNPHPMWVYDLETLRFLEVNEAAIDHYGYSREEFLAMTITDIRPPEDVPALLKNLAEVQLGLDRAGTWRHCKKNGEIIDVEVTRNVILFGDRQAELVLAHDITARKGAEDALRESEDRYRDLIEHSSDLICTHDLEGRILSVNDPPALSLGLPREEIVGRNIRDILAPEFRDQFAAYLAQIRTKGAAQGLMTVLTATGEKRIWEYHNTLRTEGITVPIVRGVAHDVTERLRAEKALRQSEERYRLLFERNLAGVSRTTLDGKFLDCNLACAKMFGYASCEEFLAQSARDIYCDVADRQSYVARLQREKSVTNIELHLKRKDGTPIWVLENGTLVDPGHGQPAFIEGTFTDITERKLAEERLRESQERFKGLFENALLGLYRTTTDGRVLMANPALCQMLGFQSVEELKRRNLEEYGFAVFHSRDEFKRVIEEKNVIVGWEAVWKRADGTKLFVRESARAIHDDSGRLLYYEGTVEDMTERKRTEEENLRLITAIEQSAEGVVITDTGGSIQYVNPAFTRITGYSREEALGNNPRILKSGLHELAFYRQMWRTILGGATWHGEVVNRRKDGSLYTEEMNIAPVRSPSGEITHFIATKQDITARKELEQQFRQAQKMEAVGRLAGGVAHDFNNLLTIINGYSQLLLEKLEPGSPMRAQVVEIQKSGERAADLTQQLLAFSRRQVLSPQVLDLNQVIRDTDKMLRRLIGEDVECRTVLYPELWMVRADPGQIAQILMNLGVNARDAMPQGGTLTIETSNADLTEAYTSFHAQITPGHYVVLVVGDTGVGMDRETQSHIFEPFFTTKEQGKGTGLGLATVYGIVKQSGGYIWVYSEPGKGATFKIYLPSVDGKVQPGSPSSERRITYQGTETILVVEDDTSVRQLVAEVLKSQGYQVLTASDPEEAAKTSAGYEKTIDLLLTDLVMPKLNGRQLAEHLAFSRPKMKVMFMSGYTDDAMVRHGFLSPGVAFIQKPFSPQALVRKIRGVLDAGQ